MSIITCHLKNLSVRLVEGREYIGMQDMNVGFRVSIHWAYFAYLSQPNNEFVTWT
jgi:hypothetical protein